MRLVAASVLTLLACTAVVAQTADAPPPAPAISVQSSLVLVPTTVQTHSGDILYTLKPEQFVLTDNGVPQTIHLDSDADPLGLSLVVVLQCSRSAAAEFAHFRGLATMIDAIAGGGPREVALVTYGTEPTLVQAFTPDSDAMHVALSQVEPCTDDPNNATLDAVRYATSLFEHSPESNRRAILLISETRDHGSHAKAEDAIQNLGRSNTVLDAVTFSPMKTHLLDELRHGSGGGDPEFIPLLFAAVQAVRTNAPKELARLSGGEYINFTTEKGFDRTLNDLANHLHNVYRISFQPHGPDNTPPTPGFHTLAVSVPDYPSAHIRFRENYWSPDPSHPESPKP